VRASRATGPGAPLRLPEPVASSMGGLTAPPLAAVGARCFEPIRRLRQVGHMYRSDGSLLLSLVYQHASADRDRMITQRMAAMVRDDELGRRAARARVVTDVGGGTEAPVGDAGDAGGQGETPAL
jgi:hypothetical protein